MLKEIFKKNKNIVINTDIDGFLSGMLLQKYYDCKVVGFSNSRETIWLEPTVKSILEPIYIDIYLNHPEVICIDQHIIAFNKKHHNTILEQGTKLNPNLDRGRTFVGDLTGDYYHKYPFGTVHYLIKLMAEDGIIVELGDLEKLCTSNNITTNLAQIILRADDALYSTLSPYRANALDWWEWLDKSNSIPAIQELRKYINKCEISRSREYKNHIGMFFKSLGCDGIDGAFQNIVDSDGILLSKVKNFSEVIGDCIGVKLDLPSRYKIHKGTYKVTYVYPYTEMRILNSDKLFSYAFIFGPNPKYPNFSFTMDMN